MFDSETMPVSAGIRAESLKRCAVAGVAAISFACGGGSGGGGTNPPTLTIQKAATASGDAQTDSVSSTLPTLLRVLVTLGTTPGSGDTVTWDAIGPGASVSPLESVTDPNGVATTTWTLGHVAGTQTATATLSGAAGSPVTFTATATPGTATQMLTPTGNGQAGTIGTVLGQPLGVTIADQNQNGVPGVVVAWQVTSGSAGVSPPTAASNTSGIAQTSVTLGGTPGPITITAVSGSLAGSPQSFSATAQPIPTAVGVTVGPGDDFTSDRNRTSNPAIDTVATGGTVTWTWAIASILHSVESMGMPGFPSSMIQMTGTYAFTFSTSGVYHYKCAVQGHAMTGIVVVR